MHVHPARTVAKDRNARGLGDRGCARDRDPFLVHGARRRAYDDSFDEVKAIAAGRKGERGTHEK
jgi:hypothetical protein